MKGNVNPPTFHTRSPNACHMLNTELAPEEWTDGQSLPSWGAQSGQTKIKFPLAAGTLNLPPGFKTPAKLFAPSYLQLNTCWVQTGLSGCRRKEGKQNVVLKWQNETLMPTTITQSGKC